MARCVLQSMVPARAVLVGWGNNATNELARTEIGVRIVRKFATARTTTQNSVILGLENVFAKPDGTATPAPDLVHSTLTARAVKTAVTARITHNVRQ